MDVSFFLQVVCAVVIANGACAAGAIGFIAASRLEKRGASQDNLPLWVYVCVLVPFATALPGAWILYKLV